MIYAVGTWRLDHPCLGGLYMLDVSDPTKPTSLGCFSDDGYVHDGKDPSFIRLAFKLSRVLIRLESSMCHLYRTGSQVLK